MFKQLYDLAGQGDLLPPRGCWWPSSA